MKNDEDVQITGNISDYLVQRLDDETQGQEFTLEYLKADFLAAAMSLPISSFEGKNAEVKKEAYSSIFEADSVEPSGHLPAMI